MAVAYVTDILFQITAAFNSYSMFTSCIVIYSNFLNNYSQNQLDNAVIFLNRE